MKSVLIRLAQRTAGLQGQLSHLAGRHLTCFASTCAQTAAVRAAKRSARVAQRPSPRLGTDFPENVFLSSSECDCLGHRRPANVRGVRDDRAKTCHFPEDGRSLAFQGLRFLSCTVGTSGPTPHSAVRGWR